MGSKDAPQKNAVLRCTKKSGKSGRFYIKTPKWRETPKDSAITEAK